MPRLLSLAALAVLLSATAAAQPQVPLATPYVVPGTESYDASIPTPQAVLGYTIGERHTRPEEVIRYVEAVAEASPRVTAAFHGSTYEGRRMVHAIVTAPENHARLETIREANLRLSDAPDEVDDATLAAMPIVVYQGYTVHGNEASGVEAALVYLYHLAAAQGDDIDRQLSEAVILLDPLMNPDGSDRFADWVNGYRGGAPVADPNDREHREAWPGGRTNHYFFDLNRDWLPTELKESRARMAWWHTWRPQVSTDHHEMGSEATFFFQPGIPSRNNPNTPAATFELTGAIARYHADELDRIGQLYYSEESFDDFYYGKGSTYPDINGAVGILFEQASSRGLRRTTEQNGEWTYAVTVRNQVATSLSTLRAAIALRERLLANARTFYAADKPEGAYVISLARHRTRGQALAQTLRRSRVRMYELAEDVTEGGKTFAAGQALVVPMDQTQGRLVEAAMERVLTFPDSLFYDVSAWTFPLAYGADVAEVRRSPRLGAEVETPAFDGGRVVGGQARVAYAIPWGRYFAPRALRRFHEAGLRVRLAKSPFEAQSGGARQSFARGTLIVETRPGGGLSVPADTVHAVVARAVAMDHVEAFALDSGLTPAGNDLGSREWPVLQKPRIGLMAGVGTSSYGVGEVWHLLSERFGQEVSLLDPQNLPSLDSYTTLVLPNGSYGSLDSADVERMKEWVQRGGVVIGIQGGAQWAARGGLLASPTRDAPPDSTAYPYSMRDEARGAQALGGSILDLRLDPTHPLAYGYGESVAVFKSGTAVFKPDSTNSGVDVGRYAATTPVLSGYASDQMKERLEGAAALRAARLGRGRVVLMDFNPSFRAFWYGTDGLLLNAIYLGGTF
ncbi:MAG: M14 family zinc carboxypeptidase [Bacteroidota bacterium]